MTRPDLDLAEVREQHQWIERYDCGAISVKMEVDHGTARRPRYLTLNQRCTLTPGHEGPHRDQLHCYQFPIHTFTEEQVDHYDPRDLSGCSCRQGDCPVAAMLELIDVQAKAYLAMTKRLMRDGASGCEVTKTSGTGPCWQPVVAARFDGMFIDMVCEEHARRAEHRWRHTPGDRVVTWTEER